MECCTKKILVVDDSNTNIVLLDAVLTSKGYKTLTALSVEEALTILNKETPGLILLDLLMPKVNGYEFLASIKKNETTRNIPVIIISAVTNTRDIKKSRMLGADDYIEKPVNINTLLTKIQTMLQN
jgi:DNA-binding response OmpR family regulator